MKLFTKDIDAKLFAQYPKGSDLANQMVVAKIFNPYGRGTWYLLNSDPEDPDYIWAIVNLFEPEVGSVSRSELESIKVPPFRLGLERDLSFHPVNASELLKGLYEGKHYAEGGSIEEENAEMVESQNKAISHHTKELQSQLNKGKETPAWVVSKVSRASNDLSDVTHYLDGKKMANGGNVDYFSKFDLNDKGNFAATIDGINYEIIYRDDISEMYDLFANGVKVSNDKLLRNLMIFDKYANGGGVNGSTNISYSDWEEAVANSLSDKLEIPFGDAQGIIEANEFYMAQAWSKGLDSQKTADYIDSKTSMAKGGGVGKEDIYKKIPSTEELVEMVMDEKDKAIRKNRGLYNVVIGRYDGYSVTIDYGKKDSLPLILSKRPSRGKVIDIIENNPEVTEIGFIGSIRCADRVGEEMEFIDDFEIVLWKKPIDVDNALGLTFQYTEKTFDTKNPNNEVIADESIYIIVDKKDAPLYENKKDDGEYLYVVGYNKNNGSRTQNRIKKSVFKNLEDDGDILIIDDIKKSDREQILKPIETYAQGGGVGSDYETDVKVQELEGANYLVPPDVKGGDFVLQLGKGGSIKTIEKGEEYRYKPNSSIEKDILAKVDYVVDKTKFAGNFYVKGHRNDTYIYFLDDFDRNLVKDIPLKLTERIYRTITRTAAIGGMSLLVKINLENGLVYYLNDEKSEKGEIEFVKKGELCQYLNLVQVQEEDYYKNGGAIATKSTSTREKLNLKKDATYIPKRDIQSVELKNFKSIPSSDIIDGVYRKKATKNADSKRGELIINGKKSIIFETIKSVTILYKDKQLRKVELLKYPKSTGDEYHLDKDMIFKSKQEALTKFNERVNKIKSREGYTVVENMANGGGLGIMNKPKKGWSHKSK